MIRRIGLEPVTGEPRMLIGGKLVGARSGHTYPNINPATEEPIGATADGSAEDLDDAIAAARRAFDNSDWSRDPTFRRHCLEQLKVGLDEIKEELRRIDTAEAGRPIARTTMSIDANISALDGWAALADQYEYERVLPHEVGILQREPFGVVGAILTWNCGFFLNVAKAGPALAAGNTLVMRPAPQTPWQSTVFGRVIAERTDIPPGVINIVTSADPSVAAFLTEDPRVDMITFTGSSAVGRRIMAQSARTMKKVHLELGGKSAAVLLDDADFESIMPFIAGMLCGNSGQTCAALSRLLLPRSRYREGVEVARSVFAGIVPGDPTDPACGQGPVISARQRDRVLGYIKQAKAEGARLVVGGRKPTHLNRGYFVEPTVFADVDRRATIAQEEIFGPVLAITPYEDDDSAVDIANDSEYGLSGAVWSGSETRATDIARRLRTGMVSVNGASAFGVGPFGGYKQSGNGREGGVFGFEEYLEMKSIGLPAH